MSEQHLIDLARRDFLAAAIDQLLETSRQAQVAFGVDTALVTGPEPAVGERLALADGIAFVARHDVRAANHDLAASHLRGRIRPGASMIAMSGPAARPTDPGLRTARRQRVARHLMRRLRHAIRLDHRRTETSSRARPGRAAGSAADEDRMSRSGTSRIDVGMRMRPRARRLMHGRHGRVPASGGTPRATRKSHCHRPRRCTPRWRRQRATPAPRPSARGCGTAA